MAAWSRDTWVGPYRVHQRLQRRWVGTLWQGLDGERGQEVWLLSVERHALPWVTASRWEQFGAEVESITALSHPHLLACLDAIELAPEHWCLVWEAPVHTPSQPCDLPQLLAQEPGQRAGEEYALDLVEQIALGVQSLHGQGHIHGALEPEAVLVDWRPGYPVVRVGFVGLFPLLPPHSLMASDPSAVTASLLPYYAPEATDAPLPHHPTVDLYALGMLLWTILHGDSERPAALSQSPLWERFSPLLQGILRQTLAPDPGARVSHCRPLLQQITGADTLAEDAAIDLYSTLPMDLDRASMDREQIEQKPRARDTLPYVHDELSDEVEDAYLKALQRDLESLLPPPETGSDSAHQTTPVLFPLPEDSEPHLDLGETLESRPDALLDALPDFLSETKHTPEPPTSRSPERRAFASSDPLPFTPLPAPPLTPPPPSLPAPIPEAWERQALRDEIRLLRRPYRFLSPFLVLLGLGLLGYFFLW